MSKLLKLGSLHILRGSYNALVSRLESIPLHERTDRQKVCLETYPVVRTQTGLTCNACGLNPMERRIITAWYSDAIRHMELALDVKCDKCIVKNGDYGVQDVA